MSCVHHEKLEIEMWVDFGPLPSPSMLIHTPLANTVTNYNDIFGVLQHSSLAHYTFELPTSIFPPKEYTISLVICLLDMV